MKNSEYKQNKFDFTMVVTIVYTLSLIFYGTIMVVFLALWSFVDNNTYPKTILFLFVVILFFIPASLAIHAHKNKKDIEALFFLGYMVFAPMITIYLYLGSTNNIQDSNSTFFLILAIFILSIPFIFLFRNCYLWYRESKNNKTNAIESNPKVSSND